MIEQILTVPVDDDITFTFKALVKSGRVMNILDTA